MSRAAESESALGAGSSDFQEDGTHWASTSTPCPWSQSLLCCLNTSPGCPLLSTTPSLLEPTRHSESLTAAGVTGQNHKSHSSPSY